MKKLHIVALAVTAALASSFAIAQTATPATGVKAAPRIDWEYAPQLGRSAEQAIGAFEDRLAWMRGARSDYEIALPLHEIDFAAMPAGRPAAR